MNWHNSGELFMSIKRKSLESIQTNEFNSLLEIDVLIIKQTNITDHGTNDSLKNTLTHLNTCKQDLGTSYTIYKWYT